MFYGANTQNSKSVLQSHPDNITLVPALFAIPRLAVSNGCLTLASYNCPLVAHHKWYHPQLFAFLLFFDHPSPTCLSRIVIRLSEAQGEHLTLQTLRLLLFSQEWCVLHINLKPTSFSSFVKSIFIS